MTMSGLQFESISPFGVSLTLQTADTADPVIREQLRRLYARDGLMVIRGLELTHDEQKAFCRIFGPVPGGPSENFIISNTAKGGYLGDRELLWHNDVPYLPSPYLAASLHALEVEPGVTGTRFASGYRAYERLPQDLRDRITGMNALQVRERVWDRPNRLTDMLPGDICTVHPVVRTQPGTGRPYLFVNQDMTACIIGLSESDSTSLLEELYSYFYVESDVYQHPWAKGDMVIWDNLAIQHARGRPGQGVRTLQRVTVTELGYCEQYPTDMAIGKSMYNENMLQAQG